MWKIFKSMINDINNNSELKYVLLLLNSFSKCYDCELFREERLKVDRNDLRKIEEINKKRKKYLDE